MLILGIETSCDETAASVVSGEKNKVEVISNIISSQVEIHKEYGGVVPEMAAREHVVNIIPVIEKALEEADISREEAADKLGAIAVANRPGLITSLLTGIETAKVLSYFWNVPIVPVDHIQGHISANFIGNTDIDFPAVALTVSGGHTSLFLLKNHHKSECLGGTRDDAAGEAFDKAAKLMGLGYPGGPLISEQAEKWKGESGVSFPRPMINSNDNDFSFSGLKTSLLYKIKDNPDWKKDIPMYSHEFESAIVEVLVKKLRKAAEAEGARSVMLAGGVSANKRLRKRAKRMAEDELGAKFFMPDMEYTTDNAAMIASAGYFLAQAGEFVKAEDVKVSLDQS